MYDVEKLVSVVCDYLDAEADYMKGGQAVSIRKNANIEGLERGRAVSKSFSPSVIIPGGAICRRLLKLKSNG